MHKSVHIPLSLIQETLATQSREGKNLLEPIKSFCKERGVPLQVLEDCRVVNEPEVHMHEADLWYCIEGEAEFVMGGTLVNPREKLNSDGTADPHELKGSEITGGDRKMLKQGDWLWIPAGQPHQHSADATARLVIIKIPQKNNH